jgi:glycosyltransferase involved in cell wall biosynthesis
LICLRVSGQYPGQRFYFKYLLPLILRSTEKVLVISEFTRDDVVDAYNLEPEKVVVNPNGGNHLLRGSTYMGMPQEISGIVKGRPYFLAVGASYPNKNLERLIDAFLLVERDCCLVITGISSSYGQKIKRKNRNNSKLIFLDFVPNEVLTALYRGACANVYVSLYEGFGFPPYEAAANGTVSIVSNISSLPEIYGASVYYVDPTSVEEISLALNEFLEGVIDLESYRTEFPALLERYTWEKTAAKIIETIDEVNDRHE